MCVCIICTYMCLCMYMYACIYDVYVCMMCMYVCMYVCVCVNQTETVSVFRLVAKGTVEEVCIYLYMYVCMYMYVVCICAYLCMSMYFSLQCIICEVGYNYFCNDNNSLFYCVWYACVVLLVYCC